MDTAHGAPIWYELTTPDPEGARAFYEAVAGWSVDPAETSHYRMIRTGDGEFGGMLRLDEAMKAEGLQPGWLIYFGVADVDAAAAQARSLGGAVHVPPTDIAGVGRFALLSDPQGAPFYVMRTDRPANSPPFAPGEPGRCGWNELWTSDAAAALGFYAALFGWENRETMDMGPALGGYHFLDLGALRLGALTQVPDAAPGWNAYVTVADLDRALEAVAAGGGRIEMGPHVVPTGERIVQGRDPAGARFALVGPGA